MKSGSRMHCFLKMTWMEALLFLREPVSAFFTLVFPLMMLFLYGSIFNSVPVPECGGQGVVASYIPTVDSYIHALTAMIIGTTGMMSITITMATYRENGILRGLRTTPVSPLIVLAAKVTVLFVMISLGVLLLIAIGELVYHVRFDGNAFSMLGGFILSSLSFFGIGFILAGTMPTARSAQMVAMVFLYSMLILSGAFFSLGLLPETVQKVSNFLPLTYVFNLLRGLWMGEA
jgi:ABC-2 type transport system permease protein